MAKTVNIFGTRFCVPKDKTFEQGKGFCRVIDKELVKERTIEKLKKEENVEKIISIDVIQNNWDEFSAESSKPNFKIKDWLIKHLPNEEEKEYIKKIK